MGNEVGGKCLDSGYILKTEPTGYSDEHNVGSQEWSQSLKLEQLEE